MALGADLNRTNRAAWSVEGRTEIGGREHQPNQAEEGEGQAKLLLGASHLGLTQLPEAAGKPAEGDPGNRAHLGVGRAEMLGTAS